MSEVLSWQPTSPSGVGVLDTLGAPPPPRLKLDILPSRLGGDKGETASITPPNLIAVANHNGSDSSSTSNGGPLSPTNGGVPPQYPTQPCLLANRYLVTRAIDISTSEAIHLPTQTSLLVKVMSLVFFII